MDFSFFGVPAVILLVITTILLLITNNWRYSIGALGLMYLGAFFLVAESWPVDLAVIKLVSGWMAGSVLGMTSLSISARSAPIRRAWPTQSVFYVLVASLVIAAVATFAPRILEWVPFMSAPQAWGGLILIGMGLLHLGFSTRSLRITLGLLTLLAGFEILYAVVEASTLVAGLLALINLGVALAGAYLIITPTMEEQPS
jgi:hypothetical protein